MVCLKPVADKGNPFIHLGAYEAILFAPASPATSTCSVVESEEDLKVLTLRQPRKNLKVLTLRQPRKKMDDQNLLDMDVDAPVVKWRTSNSSEKKRSGGDKQSGKLKKKRIVKVPPQKRLVGNEAGMFSQKRLF